MVSSLSLKSTLLKKQHYLKKKHKHCGEAMATTIFDISNYLKNAGIKHHMEEEDQIVTAFQTHHYIDSDQESLLVVLIRVSNDGAFVSLTTPACYQYFKGPHTNAINEALLILNWNGFARYKMDFTDGEIQASVDILLLDSLLTETQFISNLLALVKTIDEHYLLLQPVIQNGDMRPMKATFMPDELQGPREKAIALFYELLMTRKRQSS